MPAWFERELREGGLLQEYLERERRRVAERWSRVSRRMDGFRQNNRSDWRLVAAVPSRDFHRWQRVDPDFWRDNANLRSLKRDNPNVPIFL